VKRIEDAIKQRQFKTLTQKAFIGLILTGNQLVDQTNDILKPFGISHQQYNVLRILRGAHPKPLTMAIIRERMLDKQSDVSRIIARLVNSGLVTSCVSDLNKRACDVRISPQGIELLRTLDEVVNPLPLSDLTEDDLGQLINYLERILK
jgi:DNA-binding MarR family transcriptional regulator